VAPLSSSHKGVRPEAAKVANIAEDANIFFWQPRGEGLIDALLIAPGVVLLGAFAANRARVARVRGVFVGATRLLRVESAAKEIVFACLVIDA
jgi:hypothetical protein